MIPRSVPDKLFKLSEVLIYKNLTDFRRKTGYCNFCGHMPVPENILMLGNIVAVVFPRACDAVQPEKYILFQELL